MQNRKVPELRFKEFTEEWEEKRLEDISNINKGTQLNRSELIKNGIGLYPAINGGIEASGYSDTWNMQKNTVTISEGGNSCGYVNYMQEKFWCGGHCYALNPKIDVSNLFLYQVLKFNEIFIMRMRVGSGLPNIQKKDIVSLKLNLPLLQEQQKIALFLSKVDDKIEKTEKKKVLWETYKKGIMQKIFSQ